MNLGLHHNKVTTSITYLTEECFDTAKVILMCTLRNRDHPRDDQVPIHTSGYHYGVDSN